MAILSDGVKIDTDIEAVPRIFTLSMTAVSIIPAAEAPPAADTPRESWSTS
jgi:hypothetical protein